MNTALIVGVTGIVGRNLAELLGAQSDWNVIGLARRPLEVAGVKRLIEADLLDREGCQKGRVRVEPVTCILLYLVAAGNRGRELRG
jgi:nucleoside-diphosphate-sugar epimerase